VRVAELRKVWDKRYTALCRERKIRTIGGYGYLATDTYISSNALTVNRKGDDVHLSWWCETKPLAIDPILWTIFMPETDLGSERKRLSLRVNGAFTATGLKIAEKQPSFPLPPTRTFTSPGTSTDLSLLTPTSLRITRRSTTFFLNCVRGQKPPS
jgi:hypothetical protein